MFYFLESEQWGSKNSKNIKIYQKLADILLSYQNHKKVVTVEIKIWEYLQYDDLILDIILFFPTV